MSDKEKRCPKCMSWWVEFVDNYFGGYTTLECQKCQYRWKA